MIEFLTDGAGNFTNPVNGLGGDSAKKVKKTSRKAKKQNLEQNRGDLSIAESGIVANGYQAPPTAPIAEPDERAADFYRYGEGALEISDSGETNNVAGGEIDTRALQPGSVNYDLMPRLIEEFDDQEASIRLFGKKPGSKEEADLIPPYTKFFLQAAQESYNERNQIVETFGDYYVFFFGQRPQIYNFSGTLLNSRSSSWLNDWKFMYQNFLRGTRAVENNARIVLSYGGRQIEGYILNTSNNTVADNPLGASFSFQLLLIDEKFINFSNDFGLVVSDGKLSESQDFLQLLTEGPLSQADVDRALQQAREVMNKDAAPSEGDVLKGDRQSEISNDFGIDTQVGPNGNLTFPSGINIA